MPLESVGRLPGKKDINGQFSRGNIKKTLEYYNSIKNQNGDYEFGALTDVWYTAGAQWMSDVKLYPQPIRDQIKKYIIEALTNQTDGKDDPIAVTFKWSDGNKAVNCSYDPSVPSYTIEIVGYPSPPASLLAER